MLRRVFGKTPAIAAALGLAFALVLTGCDGGGGGLPTHWGETMRLTGQVFTVTENDDDMPTFAQFNADRTVIASAGELTGGITGGRLDITVGRPTAAQLETPPNLGQFFSNFAERDDITAVPNEGVSVTVLGLTAGGEPLSRGNFTGSESATGYSLNIEGTMFIFVSQQVVVSAEGFSGTEDGVAYNYRAFNLTLSEGWNAISTRFETSFNFENNTGTYTVATSRGQSGRWILDFDFFDLLDD